MTTLRKLHYVAWNVNLSLSTRWCCSYTGDIVTEETCSFLFLGCKQKLLWGLDHRRWNTEVSVLHSLMAEDGREKQSLKTLLSQLARREWLTIRGERLALIWPSSADGSGAKSGDGRQASLDCNRHSQDTWDVLFTGTLSNAVFQRDRDKGSHVEYVFGDVMHCRHVSSISEYPAASIFTV
jgi:hypothetical protein